MTTLLVDGDNLAMRALHAVSRDTMNAEGVNTGVLVIFMNMLGRAVRENEVDRLLVAFDCHDPLHPLVRKEVFSDYKAQRKDAPAGRDEAFALIDEVLTGLGVPMACLPSMEGDDVIASAWAWERANTDNEVLILSGDKDLLQLVDQRTVVLRPGHGDLERWDVQKVWDHYQLLPESLGHYLALVGDVADNIPGVRGIGPKKAWKIVREMHLLGETFEALIDRMEANGTWDDVKVAQANLSWVMVDLRTDPILTPGVVVAADLDIHPEVTAALDAILSTFGLSRLRQSVERGTLWREAKDPQQDDLLAALEEAEGH